MTIGLGDTVQIRPPSLKLLTKSKARGIMVVGMEDNYFVPDLTQSLLELREALLKTVEVINKITSKSIRRGVTLVETGTNKISIIKIIREHTNWGLRESKDASEMTPTTFYIANAEEMIAKLRAAGATATICDGECDDCKDKFKCYTNAW